jgi:hypothetical protein
MLLQSAWFWLHDPTPQTPARQTAVPLATAHGLHVALSQP